MTHSIIFSRLEVCAGVTKAVTCSEEHSLITPGVRTVVFSVILTLDLEPGWTVIEWTVAVTEARSAKDGRIDIPLDDWYGFPQ